MFQLIKRCSGVNKTLFLGLFFIFSCSKNNECFNRQPVLVAVEVPAMGNVNEIIQIEVTFKAIYSDDQLAGTINDNSGNERGFQFWAQSCNGYRIPKNLRDKEVIRFDEKGDYTLIFYSSDGNDIIKEITIL